MTRTVEIKVPDGAMIGAYIWDELLGGDDVACDLTLYESHALVGERLLNTPDAELLALLEKEDKR